MELTRFYDMVEAHADLAGVGIDVCSDERKAVVVKHTPSGMETRVPVDVIEESEWAPLEAILTGKREPQVLQHMTRVVGYFSRVENWNKSKVGELRDRHKGDYSIAG